MGRRVTGSHSRSVLSQAPDTMRRPSGETATHLTESVWPDRGGPRGRPLGMSHRRRLMSLLAVTSRRPSGRNARPVTESPWPVRRRGRGVPLRASHRMTVLSSLPEAMRRPSGLKATVRTESVWPFRGGSGAGCRPSRPTCHRRRVLSVLALTSHCPSGLKSTARTASSWARSGGPTGSPVSAFHSCKVASSPPVTRWVPSRLRARLRMGWAAGEMRTRLRPWRRPPRSPGSGWTVPGSRTARTRPCWLFAVIRASVSRIRACTALSSLAMSASATQSFSIATVGSNSRALRELTTMRNNSQTSREVS